ncbi:DUF5018 domain-containing protein [Spirosoma sp. HMF4905]|uniref:DUF5018 domain-containing protein n=1 Tax=Spirosoma arboris TaxID=2682092 RepID=A0A7K1SD52_9BACT|nr:DUF5018 domain-containing protein [Spirosoma arboris]MVM31711.1 DUF5018 domain-containing protein [Spirosoma arboris]
MKTLARFSILLVVVLSTMGCPNKSDDPTPQATTKSSSKAIVKFTADGVDFVIDESKQTISAVYVVSGDIDIQNLYFKPTITLSDKATCSPASGVQVDLLNPIKYVVTAEDGTTKTYTVEIAIYDLPGNSDLTLTKSTGSTPTKLSFTYLVPSITSLFAGTWVFDRSEALEVRKVGSDQVLTLLQQTPTTQTVTVQVNGVEKSPTTSSGKFGNAFTLTSTKTYTSTDDQGDSGSGAWSIVDLGKSALNRYELKLDGVTIVSGGPSASGIVTFYVVSINATELRLTRDPTTTSSSTTSFFTVYKKQ